MRIIDFFKKLRSRRKARGQDKELEKYDDISFAEWDELPFETKAAIWNHRWDPWNLEVGLVARENIIQAFRDTYPELSEKAIAIGIGWFGWYVAALYVVVAGSSTRVPMNFSDLFVNKGILQERVDDHNLIVAWRYGGSRAPFSPSTWEPQSREEP